jgi:signal transduction histidine kinase
MRTMFVKFFFWFWLTTILAGGLSFLLAFNLRLSPFPAGQMRHFDEERRGFASGALSLYALNAAALYEKGSDFETAGGGEGSRMKAYLFAADGSPLSKEVPQPLRDALRGQAAASFQKADPETQKDILVVKALGPSGRPYWAATFGMSPHQPGKPPGFPFPPHYWSNFAVTFLISGVVCYLLAWRLTTPIRRLRAATQSLAGGDLAARVEVSDAATRDELSDLGHDFNRMAERIEKLVASHRQLLRDVSHELRSPLARLGVALGLARKYAPSAAGASLDRIEQEAERLNLMIGELLTLSLLEGGSGAVSFEQLDLSELVEEVVRDADFEAEGSGRSVRADCSGPVGLRGNRELLRRALENVVRNAVRYTKEGSCVEVSLKRDDAGSGCVLMVRDQGPGVPEAELADIFRPFYRVAQARERQSGGNGIGLAISEGTVTLHGGSIVARNHGAGGLEVEISLPVA